MLKYITLLSLLLVCVSGHAVLRTPKPWNTEATTTNPCGGGTQPTTPTVTYAAGSKQTVVWDVIAGDGVGDVTALIDPAGGTNFRVAVQGLQAEKSTTTGLHTYTITVPDIKCTGTNGICNMQVKSASNWISCTSLAITQTASGNNNLAGGKAVASGQSLIGNETPVDGQLISVNLIAAIIIVPGIVMAPLIGLFALSVMDKTAGLGEKIDGLGSNIRGFYEKQALDQAGQFVAQFMRILSFTGLFSVLVLIWSAIATAYMSGPISGVGMAAAALITACTAFGFFAALRRDLNFLFAYVIASLVTAAIQIVFLALVFAYYASLAKMDTNGQTKFTPITAILTVIVMVQVVLLPLNLVANTYARRARKSLAVGGYQPQTELQE